MTNAARLPFTISNQSLTFYVKGKPHSLVRDHASYAKARELLQAPGDHDVDHLLALVDVRQALLRESQGRIVFDGDDIIFQGKPLHNVWVDKILDFRDAREDFSPIWNALDRLVHNPTPAAIERLPVFLERTKLGFLPDGRFIAFKGVQSDYCSAHASPDGTRFTHQIGDKPRMPREQVDADPNQTCSTGLHVGAPGYVRQHYSGGTYALVLVAVDPVDVVAVPTDYNGEKMRVCGYEVIDHLDQDYSDELLGKLRTTVTGYAPQPSPVEDDEDQDDQGVEEEQEPDDLPEEDELPIFKAGQVIEYEQYSTVLYGLAVEANGVICVRDLDGEVIKADAYLRVLDASEITAATVACYGALVRIEGDTRLRDGDYTIVGYSEDDDDNQLDASSRFWKVEVDGIDGGMPILNSSIKVVNLKGEHLWPRTEVKVEEDAGTVEMKSLDGHDLRQDLQPALQAQVGDRVETVEGGWPPAGIYEVVQVDEGCEYRLTLQTEHDGQQGVLNRYVKRIVRD